MNKASCWTEWRAEKREKYTLELAGPVEPTPLRTDMCLWCWGQRFLMEPIKIEDKTVAYLPVVCRNCDGYGKVR